MYDNGGGIYLCHLVSTGTTTRRVLILQFGTRHEEIWRLKGDRFHVSAAAALEWNEVVSRDFHRTFYVGPRTQCNRTYVELLSHPTVGIRSTLFWGPKVSDRLSSLAEEHFIGRPVCGVVRVDFQHSKRGDETSSSNRASDFGIVVVAFSLS